MSEQATLMLALKPPERREIHESAGMLKAKSNFGTRLVTFRTHPQISLQESDDRDDPCSIFNLGAPVVHRAVSQSLHRNAPQGVVDTFQIQRAVRPCEASFGAILTACLGSRCALQQSVFLV
eukprot:scaffold38073_cov15-Prasinocladus_malaysianus.AAC.1